MNLNLTYLNDSAELVLVTVRDSCLIRCVHRDPTGIELGNYTTFASMPKPFRTELINKLRHEYQTYLSGH